MRLLSLATQALSWAGVFQDVDRAAKHGGVLSRKIKDHIHEARARWHVNGMAVVVVTSPQHNALNGKGHTWRVDIVPSGDFADAKGNPVDEDSLFAIASNSKLFTALSIGLLIDRGALLPNGEALDWSTKLKDILPEWKLADEYASDHVDILDLASMRSGVPSNDIAHRSQPVIDMVANLRNLKPTAEIRQEYQYNNEHYFTMAAIVQRVTNTTLHDFVQTNFFDRLDMSSSTYNATLAAARGHRTDGFVHTGQNLTMCREKSHGVKHMHKSCHGDLESIGWWAEGDALENAGAGGVITSARDIAKWLRELLDPQVIPSHLLDKCATPVINTGQKIGSLPETTFYGMGQFIGSFRGHEIVSHTGGVPGQTSLILRVPSLGIAIAVLTNDGNSGPMLFYATAFGILDQLIGKPERTMTQWEERMFAASITKVPFPLPSKPSPPEGGFDSIPGRYEGTGYGDFNLTRLEPSGNEHLHQTIMKDLASAGVDTRGPVFIAPYGRTFVSHILLTPFDGQHFNWTALRVYEPDGRPVAGQLASGPAVVTSAGIGMFGRFSTQGPGIKLPTPEVEDVETKSAVWFKRI